MKMPRLCTAIVGTMVSGQILNSPW